MMKSGRFLTFVITILLLMILLTAGSAENLLENGDFQILDEEGLPEGWYTDAYTLDTGYTVFGIAEGDSEHPYAAEICNIGENDARFAQTVNVDPDSLYLLSGYIRAEGVEGGHGANLSVEGVYAFSRKYYDTDGQWQRIEYYGETGPDQDYITVFARLGGYSGVSTGKAAFADLSLTKVDSIPGDATADLWYRETAHDYGDDDDDEYSGEDEPQPYWPRLLLIVLLYSAAAAGVIQFDHEIGDLRVEVGRRIVERDMRIAADADEPQVDRRAAQLLRERLDPLGRTVYQRQHGFRQAAHGRQIDVRGLEAERELRALPHFALDVKVAFTHLAQLHDHRDPKPDFSRGARRRKGACNL